MREERKKKDVKRGRKETALFFEVLRKDPVLKAACALVKDSPHRKALFLVGGVVRNLVLKKALPRDYDFVFAGDIKDLSFRLADSVGGTSFLLDKKTPSYRVAAALDDTPRTVDVSPVKSGDIGEDLASRDFTVNAMAVDVVGLFEAAVPTIIDPTGGMDDCVRKILRMTSADVFSEDPLRCLRAVRIALEYGLEMTPETRERIRKNAPLVRTGKTSPERVRDELLLVFASPGTARAIEDLYRLNLMEAICPELAGWADVKGYDLLAHSLKTLEEAESFLEGVRTGLCPFHPAELKGHFHRKTGAVGRDVVFKLAAFLHDAGKPSAMTTEEGRARFIGHDREGSLIVSGMMKRLKLSRRVTSEVTNLVRNHHRVFTLASLEKPSPRARAHLLRASEAGGGRGGVGGGDTGAGVDLLILALVDARATRGGEDPELLKLVREMLEFYYGVYSKKRPKPLLNGNEIMDAFGITEGRLVGEIMERVSEGIEKGLIKNKREAISCIRKWLSEKNT
ncbi:MAG TPA: HD domain-containing protein [Thermodesulfobacteriota bacterium]|nr:HD domain-containing protein [Thermodesulfobacteriota bacterium]